MKPANSLNAEVDASIEAMDRHLSKLVKELFTSYLPTMEKLSDLNYEAPSQRPRGAAEAEAEWKTLFSVRGEWDKHQLDLRTVTMAASYLSFTHCLVRPHIRLLASG